MKLIIDAGVELTPLVKRQLTQLRNTFMLDPFIPIEWIYENGGFHHAWRIFPTEIRVQDIGELYVSVIGFLSHNPGREAWGLKSHINLTAHALKGVDRE